jgi:hypothetical protein
MATALAVRDRIVDRWIDSTRTTYRDARKRVYYLSLEFLIGRLLFDALCNLSLTDAAREALRDLGVDLDRLRKIEPTRLSAMAASDGSRRVSWKAWHRCRLPPTVTASVTSTVFFAR